MKGAEWGAGTQFKGRAERRPRVTLIYARSGAKWRHHAANRHEASSLQRLNMKVKKNAKPFLTSEESFKKQNKHNVVRLVVNSQTARLESTPAQSHPHRH